MSRDGGLKKIKPCCLPPSLSASDIVSSVCISSNDKLSLISSFATWSPLPQNRAEQNRTGVPLHFQLQVQDAGMKHSYLVSSSNLQIIATQCCICCLVSVMFPCVESQVFHHLCIQLPGLNFPLFVILRVIFASDRTLITCWVNLQSKVVLFCFVLTWTFSHPKSFGKFKIFFDTHTHKKDMTNNNIVLLCLRLSKKS